MKKIILATTISVVTASVLSASWFAGGKKYFGEFPIQDTSVLTKDHGGTLDPADAYSDGTGVYVAENISVASKIDNTAYNQLVVKYGEAAKKNGKTLEAQVQAGINGKLPTKKDLKFLSIINQNTGSTTGGTTQPTAPSCEAGMTYVEASGKCEAAPGCPTGFQLSGTQCIQTSLQTAVRSSSVSYTCPTGYNLSGTQCVKSSGAYKCKYISNGNTLIVDPGYNGPSGKIEIDCTLTVNGFAVDNKGGNQVQIGETRTFCLTNPAQCFQGGQGMIRLQNLGKTQVSVPINATATTSFSCPTGYTDNGTECQKTVTQTSSLTCSAGTYNPITQRCESNPL